MYLAQKGDIVHASYSLHLGAPEISSRQLLLRTPICVPVCMYVDLCMYLRSFCRERLREEKIDFCLPHLSLSKQAIPT